MVHKKKTLKSRHKIIDLEKLAKKLEKIKVVKALTKETRENKKWLNKHFHKLPLMLQVALASPRDSMFVEQIYPLYPKGELKIEKKGIRYGLVGIHKKSIYIGNIKPIGKDKAKVVIRKVFP